MIVFITSISSFQIKDYITGLDMKLIFRKNFVHTRKTLRMTIKNISILLLVLLGWNYASAQTNVKTFFPKILAIPDLSEQAQKGVARMMELINRTDLSEAEDKELEILVEKYGEGKATAWDVIDEGCSWYCGGGNYKIKASSVLNAQGTNSYEAEAANDLSYKTAWVEGKKGAGIGEYIEYHFKNNSPRVTSIIISNGYVKSEYAWKNNNRVKQLKLYVNGEIYGVLNLADVKTDQEFAIGTFGRNPDGSDLILKFEILDVYPGSKYNDTAITEIYFDGIDVH